MRRLTLRACARAAAPGRLRASVAVIAGFALVATAPAVATAEVAADATADVATRDGRAGVMRAAGATANSDSAGTLMGPQALEAPRTLGDPLGEARNRARELRERRDEMATRYENALVELERTHDELDDLRGREQRLEAQVDELRTTLGTRARDVYKHGSSGVFDALLTASQPSVAVERATLFATIQQRERVGLDDALALQASLDQVRALAHDRQQRLAELEVELEAARVELERELDDAETIVSALEEMSSRQLMIRSESQQGVYACPMDPAVTHFIDSWGHPRSGGRGHRGTDIMGPMGAPVFAFTSGVIERLHSSARGGISLYLRADDGSTYFYTHLQGYAPGLHADQRVEAGELVAFNGNTGNARGGAPHIHFERHPGGGSAVNPYPWLVAVCFI